MRRGSEVYYRRRGGWGKEKISRGSEVKKLRGKIYGKVTIVLSNKPDFI